jgi:hypothetical protein
VISEGTDNAAQTPAVFFSHGINLRRFWLRRRERRPASGLATVKMRGKIRS